MDTTYQCRVILITIECDNYRNTLAPINPSNTASVIVEMGTPTY